MSADRAAALEALADAVGVWKRGLNTTSDILAAYEALPTPAPVFRFGDRVTWAGGAESGLFVRHAGQEYLVVAPTGYVHWVDMGSVAHAADPATPSRPRIATPPAPTPANTTRRPRVGDRVRFTDTDDHATTGLVVLDDGSAVPFRVRVPGHGSVWRSTDQIEVVA